MNKKIPDFKTQHFFISGKQIKKWNKNKIRLPKGAGAKFIAPDNLVVTLLEPFYYDFHYEADECPNEGPISIYDEKWINQEIHHLPYCKELLEINEYLKQHGWFIPVDWSVIVASIREEIAKTLGMSQWDDADTKKLLFPALQNRFNLNLSGAMFFSDVGNVGIFGDFWSSPEDSASEVRTLHLVGSSYGGGGRVNPNGFHRRFDAVSVRCVAN